MLGGPPSGQTSEAGSAAHVGPPGQGAGRREPSQEGPRTLEEVGRGPWASWLRAIRPAPAADHRRKSRQMGRSEGCGADLPRLREPGRAMIPREENAGYEDTNDAERLADDPTMRVIVGRRGGPERPAASINTMSRFETEVLTQDDNVEGLGRVNATWVDRAMRFHPTSRGHEDDEDCQYGKSRSIEPDLSADSSHAPLTMCAFNSEISLVSRLHPLPTPRIYSLREPYSGL